jgi:hypothetical protein
MAFLQKAACTDQGHHQIRFALANSLTVTERKSSPLCLHQFFKLKRMDHHVVVLERVGVTISMPSLRRIVETTIPVPPPPAFQSISPTLVIRARSASVELRSSDGDVFITVEIPLIGWRSSLQRPSSHSVRIYLDA